MNDKPDKATGLYETDPSTPVSGSQDVNRDILLNRLELRLERYRNGTKSSITKLILPLAIVFPLSGCLIYYTLVFMEGPRPMWLVFTGLGFFVLGIFLVILLVLLVMLDILKVRLIANADYDFLEKFHCMHFTGKGDSESKTPFCKYFDHDLEDEPLCLICSVYNVTGK